MSDQLSLHSRAIDEFGKRVHMIGEEQWANPTPCTEWDVRALVNHLVNEQLWVPPMLAGARVDEVGDQFDGDQLGADPAVVWDSSARNAREAFAEDSALQRTVHLSYGDTPASHYCQEMTTDLVIHAWDLARGIGVNDRLDTELVDVTYAVNAPREEEFAASGLFDPPIPVPRDADPQVRLLALFGRRA